MEIKNSTIISFFCYFFASILSSIFAFFFGSLRLGEFSLSYFMLDVCIAVALAYNTGMVFEQIILGFKFGKIRLRGGKTKK